jgi:phosphatidylinositol-4,5-bisphosphate 3-kinase
MPFAFQVESKQKQVNKQMQALSKKIGFIIGYGLYRFDYLRDAEVDIFRRKMVSVRQNAVRTRDLNVYNFRPEVEARSASQKVMEKIGSSGKIQYRLTVPSSQLTKTLHFQYDETPERVIAGFLPKNNRFYLPETAKPEDLVLKVSGRAEYLVGNYKMIDFSYIRRCVMRDEKISLILVFAKDIQQSNSQPIPEEFDPIEDPTANMGSHSQLTIQGRTEAQIRTISLWDIARSYRVQITACENLNVGAIEAVYVEVGLYHGGRLLCPPLKTHQVHASRSPRWGAWLNFDLACYNLPRTARMCITVWGRWNAKKKMSQDKENDIYPLGWVNMLLMDYKGYLKSGLTKLALWPGEKANPIGTCVSLQNFDEASIYVRLDSFAHPVIFPTETYSDEYKTKALVVEPIPESVRPTIETVLASDPLVQITPESARAVWKYRYNVMHRPEALPKVLLSARSEMLDEVQEVKKLLKAWAPMPPEAALELLDSNFADMDVRAYAVTRLELLADDRVLDYLLQLVQALKYEPYLDCALGSFLLKRALRNRSVGHYFFWYLKVSCFKIQTKF